MRYLGPTDLTGEFFDPEDWDPPPGMPPRDATTQDMAKVRWGLKEG